MTEYITEEAYNQELTVIDRSLEIFKGGSAILVAHQDRADKALGIGNSIIQQWKEAYSIEDREERFAALAAVDARSNKFLANTTNANKEMKEARAAITQLMDKIREMFTEEENKLDTKKGPVPATIQTNRNQYAKDLLAEQERVRKESEAKAAKQKEEIEIRAFIRNAIAQKLLDLLASRKTKVTNSFNAITLADYDERSGRLMAMKTEFNKEELGTVAAFTMPAYYRHKTDEVGELRSQEWGKYDFDSFYTQYDAQLYDLKKSLIDKLPSKKEELLEAKRILDKAEADRVAELERQKAAEKKRQEDLAKAKGEAEKERLRKKGEQDKKDEEERLAEIQRKADEESLRLENEKKTRESAEKEKLDQESKGLSRAASERTDLEKTAGHAQTLFDQANEIASAGSSPETRQSFEIRVLSVAGWVEIFTFWFQREGISLSPADFEKKTLGSMKKYIEGVALKADKVGKKDMIESKHLVYDSNVKAVNVKEKKNG